MVDQVGVQGVVAGHEHAERVAAGPPGAAELLPQRGSGAGESAEQDGVEAGDVDAELQGVGRGQPDEPATAQRLLELSSLLGQVAAAVRRDPVRQRRVDLGQQPAGTEGDRLGAACRERTNASVRTRSTTRSVRRSASSAVTDRRTGAPCSPA